MVNFLIKLNNHTNIRVEVNDGFYTNITNIIIQMVGFKISKIITLPTLNKIHGIVTGHINPEVH